MVTSAIKALIPNHERFTDRETDPLCLLTKDPDKELKEVSKGREVSAVRWSSGVNARTFRPPALL